MSSHVIFSIIIGAIILGFGLVVGTRALFNSVKEVHLLRELDKLNAQNQIIGSPTSSILGALLAGIISATLVGLYGVSPVFFYLGPISAFVSACGVIWCFMQDINDAKSLKEEHSKKKGAAN